MRVTRGCFDRAKYDEVVVLAREMVAVVRGLSGFQSATQGVDRIREGDSCRRDDPGYRRARPVLARRPERFGPRVQALGVEMEPPEVYEIV